MGEVTTRPVDSKGRTLVHAMTDREIAEENLMMARILGDVLQALGSNPMAAAMMGGMPGFPTRP